MALVGDNGAGKSTLIKCVAGIHSPDSGEILFDGKPVHIHGPKDAARLGIEIVYQDLALCDNLDVVQNMYLGREERDWLWRLKEPIMEQRTAETLRSLSVTTIRSIRQPVASLSGGQRQSVAVAKAVQWNSKLVILDEPTARSASRRRARCSSSSSASPTRAWRRAHLAQPARRLRGATRITVLRLGRTSVSTSGRRRPSRRSCRRSPPGFPPRSRASRRQRRSWRRELGSRHRRTGDRSPRGAGR